MCRFGARWAHTPWTARKISAIPGENPRPARGHRRVSAVKAIVDRNTPHGSPSRPKPNRATVGFGPMSTADATSGSTCSSPMRYNQRRPRVTCSRPHGGSHSSLWPTAPRRQGDTTHAHGTTRLSLALAGNCPDLSDPGGHQPERARPDRGHANGGAGETRLAVASPLCRGGGAGKHVARPRRGATEYLSGLHPRWMVGGPARGVLFPPAGVCHHAYPHPPLYPLWRVAGTARGFPRPEPGGRRHLCGGRVSAQHGGHHRCYARGAGAGGRPRSGVDADGHRPHLAAGGRPRRRPVWVTALGAGGDDRPGGAPGRPRLEPPVAAPTGAPRVGAQLRRESPPAGRMAD